MTEVELRQAIADALKRFDSESLGNASTHLLDVLGYASTKRIALKPNTLANFLSMFSHGRALNDRYALPDEWKSVDFLFQITDEEVRTSAAQQFDFDSKGAYNGSIINSYLFLAIELKGNHYSRTALAGITREVNKLFDMPALILFRHGNTLTLAIINRRLHKREAGKDVLEKVTLIQDIEFTSTHRAHIDILCDLSIGALHRKHPFRNFVGLHEAWQKTLDTSELNKRFFQDLANWYFWALPQVRFPKDAPKDADGLDSLSLIRLITRVIFCWFLKEKGLLPEALFDEYNVAELLNDLSPNVSTYYKAILQNLFFATLNQEMDKREFRRSRQNFMAHNVYRYVSLLKSPNETLQLLAEVPFMNGGLFECLDKILGTKEKPQYIRIDGFSDRDDNVLKVPNDLFWGSERIVDLSEAYGENKYKSQKVSGLVRIFNRYKFTVAENTPIEEEVALDPELLGRVFENLLAAYNPETGATARKQTGSFYTPREIVNYMVDESLVASLKTKLPKNEKSEERLRQLFAYNDQTHEFAEREVVQLIKAIDHLTILDPACGSGAFPMGILHKLVFVLAKLDPGNQRWKARQLAKANEIPDSIVRERVLADIEQTFGANELDYGRKLYLIENCIYGVDIQPIAVQISKLRFFISLVVDQTINRQSENLGIRPLPNLETKFVAGNTLIGLQRPGQQLLRNLDIDAREAELYRVRERHFLARTPATKARCREQDAILRAEIAELLRLDGWDSDTATKLADWDPYDQNASADFFDMEWMFGIGAFGVDSDDPTHSEPDNVGFDVVFGNPPYGIRFPKEERQRLTLLYPPARNVPDSYCFFILLAFSVLRANGSLVFIVPNTFCDLENGEIFRRLILKSSSIMTIWESGWAFSSAVVDTLVMHLVKKTPDKAHTIRILRNSQVTEKVQGEFLERPLAKIDFRTTGEADALLQRIFDRAEPLSLFCTVSAGVKLYEVGKGDPPQTREIIDSRPYSTTGDRPRGWKRLYRGGDIFAFELKKTSESVNYGKWLAAPRSKGLFEPPKLLMRRTDDKLRAALDLTDSICVNSCHVIRLKLSYSDSKTEYLFLLAILNSQVCQWVFEQSNPQMVGKTFAEIKVVYVERLPIPKASVQHKTLIAKVTCYQLWLREIFQASPQLLTSRDTLMSAYWEQVLNGLVYELFFPEDLSSHSLRLLELSETVTLPDLESVSETQRLSRLRDVFEASYEVSNPLRGHLAALRSLEVVRMVVGEP
jgi:adenine-specific DNA-methyltransferase